MASSTPQRQLTLSPDTTATSHAPAVRFRPPRPELPDWNYRYSTTATGEIDRVLAFSPDGGIQTRFGMGDPLYRVQSLRRDGALQLEEARRFHIKDIQIRNHSLCVSLVYCTDPIRYSRADIRSSDLNAHDGDWSLKISAAELAEALVATSGRWQKTPPAWYEYQADNKPPTTRADRTPGVATSFKGQLTYRWREIAPESPHEIVESPAELTFEHLTGTGAEQTIVEFLEGGDDGRVRHPLGAPGPSKAFFVARDSTGALHSVAVLAPHPNPARQGKDAYLSRLASHPARPPNTSSWMLSKLKAWAKAHGYDRLVAIAGVGDNSGTAYKAAGFWLNPENTGWVRGDSRTREGRQAYRNGAEWYRRQWILPLTTRSITQKYN